MEKSIDSAVEDKWKTVPWQIGIVVVLLAYEGLVHNLPVILRHPVAAYWLAAKILFIVGLLKGWRWMFFVFVAITALHVIAFLGAPIVALINLVMVALVISAREYYFPAKRDNGSSAMIEPLRGSKKSS